MRKIVTISMLATLSVAIAGCEKKPAAEAEEAATTETVPVAEEPAAEPAAEGAEAMPEEKAGPDERTGPDERAGPDERTAGPDER